MKIVKTLIKKYSVKNNENWLFLHFFIALEASILKKPSSSRDIDKIDIDIKRINIFIGLTLESEVNAFIISLTGTFLKAINIKAPINGAI